MSLPCLRRYAARYYSTTPKPYDKVVLAMSGGIDSSVAAKLLCEQKLDLSAVFMRNWDSRDETGTDSGCEWEKDWNDVQRVCRLLDIPCRIVDLSKEYWNRVFSPSLDIWRDGQTPNPDVWCNREIKFGALLQHVQALDNAPNTWFATGHYARKSWYDSKPKLLSGIDPVKDQSFYLASITSSALARSFFPVGHLTKDQVRQKARQASKEFGQDNLFGESRKESMGLCFVGERGRFGGFLSSYLPPEPGPIINLETTEIIGQHQGLWNYTIGQGARIPGMHEKMFVTRKEKTTNTVFVVPGNDHPALSPSIVHVSDFSWIWNDSPPVGLDSDGGVRMKIKLRHRMKKLGCLVRHIGDGNNALEITLDTPQHGICPGQVAVLWDGVEEDWCLGCGLIGEARMT